MFVFQISHHAHLKLDQNLTMTEHTLYIVQWGLESKVCNSRTDKRPKKKMNKRNKKVKNWPKCFFFVQRNRNRGLSLAQILSVMEDFKMRFAYVVSVFSPHVLHIYVMISDDLSLFCLLVSVCVECGYDVHRLDCMFCLFFICAFCMHRHNPVPLFKLSTNKNKNRQQSRIVRAMRMVSTHPIAGVSYLLISFSQLVPFI